MRKIVLIAGILLLTGCEWTQKKEKKLTENQWELVNTNPNKIEGWLFHRNDSKDNGWSIEEGVMTYNHSKNKSGLDSSLMTPKQYLSFEISFDWKTEDYGNSGFLWGVRDIEELNQTYETGREIQIVDPAVYENKPDMQKENAGALFDMIPPSKNVTSPSGEWNSYYIRISYEENLGVLVHNKEEVLRFPLRGAQWDSLVEKSKFNTWSHFGKYEKGHISFQAHDAMDQNYPGITSFRNIKIRSLN